MGRFNTGYDRVISTPATSLVLVDEFPYTDDSVKNIEKSNFFKGAGRAITVGMADSGATYECSGTNDNLTFQLAVDYVVSLGGGRIFVLDGDYSLGHEILIVGSNIYFECESLNTVFTLQSSVNREMIVVGDAVTACSNVIIDGGSWNGNASANGGSTYSGGTKNIIRLRCDAQNCYFLTIKNTYTYNGAQNGISNESGAYTTIFNNRSELNANFGIWWENSSNTGILNNFTSNNVLGGVRTLATGAGDIIGNISKGDFGAAFWVQGGGSISLLGNQAYRPGWSAGGTAATNGFQLQLASNLTVQGNTVYGSYGNGLVMNGLTESTISHNTFRRNGQLTDNTYSDIVLTNSGGGSANHDNTITDNTFQNDTAAFYTNAVKYNIDFSQSNTHYKNIINNNVFGVPVTSISHNLGSTDGTPGVSDNSLGFNIGLNPQVFYKLGTLSTALTLNPANGNIQTGTGGNSSCAVTVSAGIARGQTVTLIFVQDGSGNRQLTWTNVNWPGNNAPLFSGTASSQDTVTLIWDGTNWNGLVGINNTNTQLYGMTVVDANNIVLGTSTGTKIGTVGGGSGQKLAFYGSTPIVQPLLATGAAHTVDEVITVLQNLGIVRQS